MWMQKSSSTTSSSTPTSISVVGGVLVFIFAMVKGLCRSSSTDFFFLAVLSFVQVLELVFRWSDVAIPIVTDGHIFPHTRSLKLQFIANSFVIMELETPLTLRLKIRERLNKNCNSHSSDSFFPPFIDRLDELFCFYEIFSAAPQTGHVDVKEKVRSEPTTMLCQNRIAPHPHC